jgi:integrase
MPKLTAKPLTQRMIDATPLPASGETALRDGDVRGLVLRLSARGSRSWRFEYRSPVTARNQAIGLGALSLADARVIGKQHRAAVAQGRCPAREAKAALETSQQAHAAIVTVADALNRFEAAVVAPAARQASRRDRMVALRKALEPFSSRPVASLTRGELLLRLDEIQAGRGPIARNRAQAEVRHWLGWCRDRDVVPSIVIDRVKKAVKEQARERVLSDDEIKALLANTADRSAFNDLVQVLVFTAMRRGEAASLQPRDLDFEAKTITVRGEVSKTRQARTIPMAGVLIPLLRGRARGVARDGYIFGDGSDFERPFSGFGKRFAALAAAMPEGEPWTLHDIRRTVATRLHEAGTDALTVEDLLGHLTGVRSGVAGVYNRASTLERQREALEAWSAKLAALSSAVSPGVSAVSAVSTVSADIDPVSASIVQLKRKTS